MRTTRLTPLLYLHLLFFIYLGAAEGRTDRTEGVWQRGPHRIIGGEDALPKEFPHQISVQHRGFLGARHVCGGTIITELYILTAASCIENYTVKSLSVVAGVVNLQDAEAQVVPVVAVVIHEEFNSETHSNNIALLKLDEALQLGDSVMPLTLPPEGEVVPGDTTCTIIGWGATLESGDFYKQLQKAEITTVTDDECRVAYGALAIEDAMMCAGVAQEEVDTCDGDEGGPLLCLGHLHGVTSWGTGCAHPYYPRVFSEVSYYRDWIMMYTSNR